jgi:predicted transcriptional regulator
MKKVKEFMSPNVISFSKDDAVSDVVKTFYDRKISGAPVVEQGRVCGVITSADIYAKINEKLIELNINVFDPRSVVIGLLQTHGDDKMGKAFESFLKTKVSGIMGDKLISIDSQAPLFDAIKLMDDNNITKLPVIDKKKLVGIITKEDVVRGFVD